MILETNNIGSSGKITYRHTILEVPESLRKYDRMYSPELESKITRTSQPKTTSVFFNGEKTRMEECRYEYGCYKSNTITITHSPPNSLVIYCKKFPHFNFWIRYVSSIFVESGDGNLPLVDELPDTKNIAGYLCKKARVTEDYGEYYVYYTDKFMIDDPTGVVLSVDKFEGVIMEKEEIPTKFSGNTYLRTTVEKIDFATLPDNTFEVSKGYQYFESIDQVRVEDRRRWAQVAEEEWKQNPLTNAEKFQFVGHWLMATKQDIELIHITYGGSKAEWVNQYRFTTCTLTNKNASMSKIQEEEACLQGRALMVEEPPNYRLYDYDEARQAITFRWNELFSYQRISEQKALSLTRQYGLE